MNLYRNFYIHRHDEIVVKRDKLLDKLSGKRGFADNDIADIMHFKGIGHKEDYSNVNAIRVTSDAFSTADIEEKFMILRRLRGVGMIMASAILTFHNPYKFAIIDTHAWNLLVDKFGFDADEKKPGSDYTTKEYEKYLAEITHIAEEYGMKPADIELTLYIIDSEKQQ